ncbi:MerR family transcriptional regulator [Qipengyuania atrilutea]|uniref:MerR family transcriptional regulator n=1 Tax=Qipengyuania atrilutea TaxID=2744473 RepID=A0A850H158_9SPHN|nr:MerR family transcriptional regulator [Actirhodobacter atriluteus]NVD43668.1 MerR family transcriptional regulator [Actirhodobacter atriluteus]
MTIEFDDGKDAGAMRTIGEVSAALDIKPHVLRYWEQQFPMLRPLKRSGSRRYYRARDVALIEEIDKLVNRQGFTIKGAKKALSDRRAIDEEGKEASVFFTEGDSKSSPAEQDLIEELKDIRQSLAKAVDRS